MYFNMILNKHYLSNLKNKVKHKKQNKYFNKGIFLYVRIVNNFCPEFTLCIVSLNS